MHPGSPDGSSEITVDAHLRGAHESVGERIEHVVDEVFTKPLLRGWLHLVCFFLAIPAGIAVVAVAESVTGRIGASVYAVGLVALFGVSGWYHRGRWSPRARALMQRLDHATIFVMIAGSYTPLCLLVLDGWVATTMLVVAWAGAALGGVLSFVSRTRGTRIARGALYIVLGWVSVFGAPQLVRDLSGGQLALLAIGGLLFTIGAIFLATNWPDPFPRVFGYHEVWHVLVVAAVACHFALIATVVSSPPGA